MDVQVRLMGKPDPIIYTSAMKLIGLTPDQVLAVGDSLEHDIYGRVNADAELQWKEVRHKLLCSVCSAASVKYLLCSTL